jgi:hypothetical protein
MKRAATALVLACLGAGALAGCNRATIESGNARLSFERARVQIASGGAGFQTVEDGVTLHSGDKVRVLTGEAELALAHGARLLLRTGSRVVVGEEPTLTAGDALAEVDERPLTVRSAGSTVTTKRGATRIRAGLALTAGVYSGAARVDSADRALDVPALRQAAIVAFGVVPAAPAPLEYRETDAWDLRYLGVAIDIGKELQAKSDGFTSQLRPGEGYTPGFYSVLLPGLSPRALSACDVALGGSLGEGRRPGEVLVGTTLALEGRGGSFATRCKEAFAFRDNGATWGLVALDQGVRSLPQIREELLAAIGRLPTQSTIAALAPPPDGPLDGAGVPMVVEDVASKPGSTSPAPPTQSTPSRPTTPVVPPTPTPAPVPAAPAVPPVTPVLPATPDPTGGLLTPVTDLVGGVVGGLLG